MNNLVIPPSEFDLYTSSEYEIVCSLYYDLLFEDVSCQSKSQTRRNSFCESDFTPCNSPTDIVNPFMVISNSLDNAILQF